MDNGFDLSFERRKKNRERFLSIAKGSTREGMQELLDYLANTDFYEAPASTKYHGNYRGGLLEHSLNVYDMLCLLNSRFNISWSSPDSMRIIALFHDICKVNFYKEELHNVKVGELWAKKPVFVVDEKEPLGHGSKSVIILQRYIHLTDQEIFCIYYHMGAYGDQTYQRQYSSAKEIYPEIMLVNLADELAARKESNLPMQILFEGGDSHA